MLPIFLSSFLGEMQRGPDIGMILGLMCLGLFINLNIINVFHQVGIKRALVILDPSEVRILPLFSFISGPAIRYLIS